MNREDIIRMAREAGLDTLNCFRDDNTTSVYYEAWPEQLERFAALIASRAAAAAKAEEREACAAVVEQTKWSNWFQADCAAAILARGQT